MSFVVMAEQRKYSGSSVSRALVYMDGTDGIQMFS